MRSLGHKVEAGSTWLEGENAYAVEKTVRKRFLGCRWDTLRAKRVGYVRLVNYGLCRARDLWVVLGSWIVGCVGVVICGLCGCCQFYCSDSRSITEAMASDVRDSKRLSLTEDKFECYDVFLSHRGPDTKTSFVGFLYKGLKDAALWPFLDCKSIDKSQAAWTCIKHAIETSQIAVIIFSNGLTHSEWCLKELHVMLGKVLPVFYKVQPWEVRLRS